MLMEELKCSRLIINTSHKIVLILLKMVQSTMLRSLTSIEYLNKNKQAAGNPLF